MLTYIFWAILAYILYRFIFHFIVPLVITTRKFRRQMRDFQTNVQQQHQQAYGNGNFQSYSSQQEQAPVSKQKATSTASKESDYIDFEEIK